MPLLEEKNTLPKETNQSANQLNSTSNQKPNSLITTIGQLLPLAPFVFEQFTGQKVPQMSGTMAEMQMALINIQSVMQTIVNNQQQLANRINQLETNASNQLTNLTNQFKNLRLTHTKEQKQIELHSNGSDFDKSRQFDRPPLKNQEPENY